MAGDVLAAAKRVAAALVEGRAALKTAKNATTAYRVVVEGISAAVEAAETETAKTAVKEARKADFLAARKAANEAMMAHTAALERVAETLKVLVAARAAATKGKETLNKEVEK